MYENTLTLAGLSPDQAAIYEILLKIGPGTARKIAQNAPYKRTLVYKILGDLQKLGLVARRDEVGKVSIYEPAHPLKLKELAEKKEEQARNAQTALEGIFGQLTSDFNLISGKPGVRFFEGIEGAQKVLADSLTASEIYSYIDNEAVDKYYPRINEEYVKQREKLQIKKKMIMVDSAYTKEHEKKSENKTTEIRVIPSSFPFTTVMQIYNDKVSYIAISPDKNKLISIIIQQSDIALMHKSLFEHQWSLAKPLFPEDTPTSQTLVAQA